MNKSLGFTESRGLQLSNGLTYIRKYSVADAPEVDKPGHRCPSSNECIAATKIRAKPNLELCDPHPGVSETMNT